MGVSYKSRLVLWTLAGGRCQFQGCNAPLLGDLISGDKALNKAYVAHIVAETPGGPRGDPVLSKQLVDDVSNLMLMCDPHHRLIDGPATWRDYPVERLQAMKVRHEARIETGHSLHEDRGSHILLYGARVGEHDVPLRFDLAAQALRPDRWAAEPRAIQLEMSGVMTADHEAAYWPLQAENLRRLFELRVRERIVRGDIRHLSVFALAPQPLLVECGRLLGDIAAVTVHQLHREPQGWDWRALRPPLAYQVGRPDGAGRRVALKLGLSATITDERIQAVLGQVPIWSISVERPHNDILHRTEDLAAFRSTLRTVFDDIKAQHGEDAVIHVFPALPVAAAVEMGRVWMPKADLPLVVHDQCRQAGGFRPRLTVGSVGDDAFYLQPETLDA